MNLTGDPNQGNKSPMFGFGPTTLTSVMPSTSGIGNSTEFVYTTNNSTNIFDNLVPNSLASNYILPNSPQISVPSTLPTQVQQLRVFGNNQSLRVSNSIPNFGTSLNWTHTYKPSNAFPISTNNTFSSSYTIPTNWSNTFSAKTALNTFGCKRKTDSPS